jgi:hypothetical protein
MTGKVDENRTFLSPNTQVGRMRKREMGHRERERERVRVRLTTTRQRERGERRGGV